MNPIAALLFVAAAVLIAAGLVIQFGIKFWPLGHLPGDIRIKSGNSEFYFPIATCLLLSVAISAILYLIRKWKF